MIDSIIEKAHVSTIEGLYLEFRDFFDHRRSLGDVSGFHISEIDGNYYTVGVKIKDLNIADAHSIFMSFISFVSYGHFAHFQRNRKENEIEYDFITLRENDNCGFRCKVIFTQDSTVE